MKSSLILLALFLTPLLYSENDRIQLQSIPSNVVGIDGIDFKELPSRPLYYHSGGPGKIKFVYTEEQAERVRNGDIKALDEITPSQVRGPEWLTFYISDEKNKSFKPEFAALIAKEVSKLIAGEKANYIERSGEKLFFKSVPFIVKFTKKSDVDLDSYQIRRVLSRAQDTFNIVAEKLVPKVPTDFKPITEAEFEEAAKPAEKKATKMIEDSSPDFKSAENTPIKENEDWILSQNETYVVVHLVSKKTNSNVTLHDPKAVLTQGQSLIFVTDHFKFSNNIKINLDAISTKEIEKTEDTVKSKSGLPFLFVIEDNEIKLALEPETSIFDRLESIEGGTGVRIWLKGMTDYVLQLSKKQNKYFLEARPYVEAPKTQEWYFKKGE
jgi:hypothetical protein